jgi:sugar phosphate permease
LGADEACPPPAAVRLAAGAPGRARRPLVSEVATPRITRTQRLALVLLVTSGVVNYIDRSTLSVGAPLIREELGLSYEEFGLLSSAFLWAYAAAQLPAGALVDRLGARLMLTISLAAWSLAQVVGGVVHTLGQFFGARVLLGIGEAPQFPTCAKVTRDWFHPRERGLTTGIWNSSSTLGSAIAVPTLTILMLWVGWRWMFIIMGALGIALAVVVYLVHRDPDEMDLSAAERAYITGGVPAASTPMSFGDWGGLFRYRTTWGLILGYFGSIYILWLYNSWLPTYLQQQWHLTIARTGWVAAIPFAFGVVGSVSGGWLCDRLLARGVSPINSRKIPMVTSLLATALFTFLTAIAPNVTVAVACITVSMFLTYVSIASAWATASVASSANSTASLGSLQNFGGYVGGALAPWITGRVIDPNTGSFASALMVGAAIAGAAAFFFLVLVRAPIGEGAAVGRP